MALENSKETSNEITIEEIQELDKDSYLIVDIRDEVEISHGAIPGAMAVQTDRLRGEIEQKVEKLGLKDCVKFMGLSDQVNCFLQRNICPGTTQRERNS